MANTRGVGRYTARGPVDGEDWQALADALNARMAERRTGQQQLATASGVSVATLRQLQRGTTGRRAQDTTLTAICRALDWPDDHLATVLRTGRTPTVGTATAETGTVDVSGLYEALRGIETQLAAMNDRLHAVEQAVGVLHR